MKFSFAPFRGLIVVTVAIQGTVDEEFLELALDTGAERTVVSVEAAKSAGFEIAKDAALFELATGSGKIFVPQIVLPKTFALGIVKENLPVFVHDLPASAQIDGVLGLDFMRGHVLTLDFKTGEIAFE